MEARVCRIVYGVWWWGVARALAVRPHAPHSSPVPQEARQMLVQSVDNQPRRTAKKPKKKRTASAKTAVRRSCSATRTARDSGAAKCSRAEMPEHYRLNLAGIPFIAGKVSYVRVRQGCCLL